MAPELQTALQRFDNRLECFFFSHLMTINIFETREEEEKNQFNTNIDREK